MLAFPLVAVLALVTVETASAPPSTPAPDPPAPEPPGLLERRAMPAAGDSAQVAIAGELVVTAAGRRLVVHRTYGSDDVTNLPCDALDVIAEQRFQLAEWAVLCRDRVVVSHEGGTREIPLDHAAPARFAGNFFFGRVAVGFDDGTLQVLNSDGGRPKSAHYDGHILAVTISDIDRGQALTDAPCATCGASASVLSLTRDPHGLLRGSLVPATASTHARAAWLGGRIVDDVQHGGVLLETTEPVADIDVVGVQVCVTIAEKVTCLAPGSDDAHADTAVVAHANTARPPAPPGSEAPIDLFTPAAVGGLTAGLLGIGTAVAAPMVLGGLAPGVRSAAIPVAALLALGGTGAALGVGGVVFGAVLLISSASPSHVGGDGSFLGSLASSFANGLTDCGAALAAAIGTILVVVCAGLATGGVLAVLAAPGVERAVGGTGPATDPFWPALGGAATAGLGAAVLVSVVGVVAGGDDHIGEDQQTFDSVVMNGGGLLFILGGSAVGGAVGYGLAHR